MYVLGIDAGGTKTVCYLADGNGTIVGEGRGSGANLQAQGELEVVPDNEEAAEAPLDGAAPAPEQQPSQDPAPSEEPPPAANPGATP